MSSRGALRSCANTSPEVEVSVGSNYDYDCAASALASDHAGNMLVGGCVIPFKTSTVAAFSVSRLAADDGALTWQLAIPGSPVPLVNALTVDENGRVVAAGSTTTWRGSESAHSGSRQRWRCWPAITPLL